MATVDDAISQAYDDVRSDSSGTNWCVVACGSAVSDNANAKSGVANAKSVLVGDGRGSGV